MAQITFFDAQHMNIFILDRNPEQAARDHCDKHVVKMILESGQLLATAHHLAMPSKRMPPIKATHHNHPCSVWVRVSLDNYRWLARLAVELVNEYEVRYGKAQRWKTRTPRWWKSTTPFRGSFIFRQGFRPWRD